MTAHRPTIDPVAMAAVVGHYPALGGWRGIVRNGLSVNTPACLLETERGTFFAKSYDPTVWDASALEAEHGLIGRLLAAGYPTPRLHRSAEGHSVVWHDGRPYALFDQARGEDRYGDTPVFGPFQSTAEVRAAGEMLAEFHGVFAEGLLPPAKPVRGLTARFELLAAPTVAEGLEALWAEVPAVKGFVADRPDFPFLLDRLAIQREALARWLPQLPRGVIHGDFIKRNLFWAGDRVVDVVDFDLWNVGYCAYDLALALLPTGFDWPELLQGRGAVNGQDLRAMLAGYETMRPLTPAEREALPWLMEAGRFEFYLSAVGLALGRQDTNQAEAFWTLLVKVYRWFDAHPDWREALAP